MFGLTPYPGKHHGMERSRNPFDAPFDMERFFQNFINNPVFSAFYDHIGQMKVDIKENEREYVVEAELPGYKKDEIDVDLSDDMLTISVAKKEETSDVKENYLRRERRYGSITRSFLVENIDRDKVVARFEDGVLSITLPKKEQQGKRGNKINIL